MANLTAHFSDEILSRCPGIAKRGRTLSLALPMGVRRGYFVPFRDADGLITGMQVKELGGKYLTLPGTRSKEMYHLAGRRQEQLFIIEGSLKATVAAHLGSYWCFGVSGVSLHRAQLDAIARLDPQAVVIALDQEINETTARAKARMRALLLETGAQVYEAFWDRD